MRAARPVSVGAVVFAAVFAVIAVVAGIGGEDDRAPAGSAAISGAGRDERAAGEPGSPAEVRAGRLLFARMGCGSCHTLAAAGSRGPIGPELDGLLTRHDRETLIAVITDPPSGTNGIMPDDFGERMTRDELDDLASFLLAARESGG